MTNSIRSLTSSNIKYLLVMIKLYTTEKFIRSIDIAKKLGVTKPRVHAMIRTLQAMELVYKHAYGSDAARLSACSGSP